MLRPQSEAAPGTLQETILAAPGQELDDIPTGASAMHSMWRWSVPQQPPSTLICGYRRTRSRYWHASSTGLPASRSGESFSFW